MDSQIGYNRAPSTQNSHLAYSRLPFTRGDLHGPPKGLGQPKLALGTSPQHVTSFIKTVVAMQLVTESHLREGGQRLWGVLPERTECKS